MSTIKTYTFEIHGRHFKDVTNETTCAKTYSSYELEHFRKTGKLESITTS